MNVEAMGAAGRAALHRALGDAHRVAIVDVLALCDRTPGELGRATGLGANLLAFHLRTLEEVGVVERRVSEGDRRRRYVRLRPSVLEGLVPMPRLDAREVLFVCTQNSARSPFACAVWTARTGRPALSAGSAPGERVQPLAVEVAAEHGVDLTGTRPRGYDEVAGEPDLVVSVCDRASERGVPFDAPRLHWSVRDPVPGDRASFVVAFADIAARVGRLSASAA